MRGKARRLADWLIYETRAGRILILLGAGALALPARVENDSRIARFANYTAPPVLAASLFGPAFATFGNAMFKTASFAPNSAHDIYLSLLNLINGWAGLVISLVAIYVVASLRWADHWLWIRIFRMAGLVSIRQTTLRFFLLTTSYSTAISAGFLVCIALLIPVAAERNGELIAEFMRAHPALVLGAGGFFALVSTIRERIERLRDREMYGPPWAPVIKGMVNLAICMGAGLLLPRFIL